MTAWLRPQADPGILIVASFQSALYIAIKIIFLSARIKHQSDKYTSVLKSLHIFLLVIMASVPLFSLTYPPHILCPPPT